MAETRQEGQGPRRPPYPTVLLGLLLFLLLAVLLAAATGSTPIHLTDAWTTLLSEWGFPVEPTAEETHQSILTDIRFPRIALAAATGACLGLAGTLLAGALRNPLAEPVTTGTAAGALLGTSLAVFLLPLLLPLAWLENPTGTSTLTGHLLRILLAALSAFGATLLVTATARTTGGTHTGPLLLAGLAINALVGATAALILFMAPVGAVTATAAVVQWIFGGLLQEAVPGSSQSVVIVLVVAGTLGLLLHRPLDLLLTGEEEAATSGVHTHKTRLLALAAAALATGAAVALAGVIAFIGLIAANLLTRLTGPNHLRLAPAAVLLGAALLVIADAAGRRIAAPAEIPAGVLTALIGAPLLLLLLVRSLKEVDA